VERLLVKGIEWRIVAYRSSPCPECGFHEALASLKAKGLEHPDGYRS
jgi:hypothetical protein